MCLLYIAIDQDPAYPVQILFNRDEDYNRPTSSLAWWSDAPDILGGRDLLRGGTWAAVRRDGAFACLTFIREPYTSPEIRRSRGELPSDFLRSTATPSEFLEHARAQRDNYWGFNLILGDKSEIMHYNNRIDKISQLSAGIHGVSNGSLNSPWPKITNGIACLRTMLDSGCCTPASCLTLLRDRTIAPDALLPSTGIPLAKERALSPIFVRLPTWGTVTSSLIRFSSSEEIEFIEWTHHQEPTIEPIERREVVKGLLRNKNSAINH